MNKCILLHSTFFKIGLLVQARAIHDIFQFHRTTKSRVLFCFPYFVIINLHQCINHSKCGQEPLINCRVHCNFPISSNTFNQKAFAIQMKIFTWRVVHLRAGTNRFLTEKTQMPTAFQGHQHVPFPFPLTQLYSPR